MTARSTPPKDGGQRRDGLQLVTGEALLNGDSAGGDGVLVQHIVEVGDFQRRPAGERAQDGRSGDGRAGAKLRNANAIEALGGVFGERDADFEGRVELVFGQRGAQREIDRALADPIDVGALLGLAGEAAVDHQAFDAELAGEN
jgi:hypothetical protein